MSTDSTRPLARGMWRRRGVKLTAASLALSLVLGAALWWSLGGIRVGQGRAPQLADLLETMTPRELAIRLADVVTAQVELDDGTKVHRLVRWAEPVRLAILDDENNEVPHDRVVVRDAIRYAETLNQTIDLAITMTSTTAANAFLRVRDVKHGFSDPFRDLFKAPGNLSDYSQLTYKRGPYCSSHMFYSITGEIRETSSFPTILKETSATEDQEYVESCLWEVLGLQIPEDELRPYGDQILKILYDPRIEAGISRGDVVEALILILEHYVRKSNRSRAKKVL
jgi:hypothetical protein